MANSYSKDLNRTRFAEKLHHLLARFTDRACFAYEVIAIRVPGRLTMMRQDFSRRGWQNYCVLGKLVIRDFMTVMPFAHTF